MRLKLAGHKPALKILMVHLNGQQQDKKTFWKQWINPSQFIVSAKFLLNPYNGTHFCHITYKMWLLLWFLHLWLGGLLWFRLGRPIPVKGYHNAKAYNYRLIISKAIMRLQPFGSSCTFVLSTWQCLCEQSKNSNNTAWSGRAERNCKKALT